jgi:hypothetical protein
MAFTIFRLQYIVEATLSDISERIKEIAKSKTESTNDWYKSLNHARQVLPIQLMDDTHFLLFSEATESIFSFNYLVKFFYSEFKKSLHIKPLFEYIVAASDASDISLANWVRAVSYMGNFLEEQGKYADIPSIIGYVQCCLASPDSKESDYDVIDTIKIMYSEFGFEAAIEKVVKDKSKR